MVVVDTSILIHLSRIGELSLLKRYFKKIIITKDVHDEIAEGKVGYTEIKGAQWIQIGKPQDQDKIRKLSTLEGIEKADASLVLLANEKNDRLLSNDAALIMVARSKGIACWWLTTFLLRCLDKKLISKREAQQILYDVVQSGMRLQNVVYSAILKEIESRK